jgi:hypothetical protein
MGNIYKILCSTIFFFILTLSSNTIQANIRYNLDDFTEGTKAALGVVNIDGNSFIKTSINPDFNVGPFGCGLDLNLYIPSDPKGPYPSELNSIVLRKLEYNTDQFGIKWGYIRNVTFGYGLLMDNFDPSAGFTSEFDNQKAASLGYLNFNPIKVEGMWTMKNVAAGRVSFMLEDSAFLGSPIIIGATVIADEDGVDDSIEGQSIYRKSQRGYGIDIGIPLAGDFFTVYTEYAQLENHGKGTSVGFKGAFFDQLDYRCEYRLLAPDFAPGYFDSMYEVTSFDFDSSAPQEEIQGFLFSAASSFMDGFVRAGLVYEAYGNDRNLLSGSLGWRRFLNTIGVINISTPFAGNQQMVADASVYYITGNIYDYIFNVRRVYYDTSKYTESWSVGLSFNLNNVLPKIPLVN